MMRHCFESDHVKYSMKAVMCDTLHKSRNDDLQSTHPWKWWCAVEKRESDDMQNTFVKVFIHSIQLKNMNEIVKYCESDDVEYTTVNVDVMIQSTK